MVVDSDIVAYHCIGVNDDVMADYTAVADTNVFTKHTELAVLCAGTNVDRFVDRTGHGRSLRYRIDPFGQWGIAVDTGLAAGGTISWALEVSEGFQAVLDNCLLFLGL